MSDCRGIVLLFLSDLKVPLYPLQFSFGWTWAPGVCSSFFCPSITAQASLFSSFCFVFVVEVFPPLLFCLCSQCGNCTRPDSQRQERYQTDLLVKYHVNLIKAQLLKHFKKGPIFNLRQRGFWGSCTLCDFGFSQIKHDQCGRTAAESLIVPPK